MRSTFYGFEIAKSGLFASQRNLDITGHNISNVNTEGYTRQTLRVESIPAPYYMGVIAYSDKSMSGQGVRMQYVDQIRDPFLDLQYREENTATKNWETQEYEFAMIEQIFNFEITDDESGISNLFADFYAALHKLAENPSDLEVRQAVLGSAQNMVDIMNMNADKILDQYNDINEAIKSSVLQINTITQSIAELNNQIFSFEMSGAQANDLRDRRNLLLDELSGYIPIDYRETSEGYLIVTYEGNEIVNHTRQKNFAIDDTANHAFTDGAMVYEVYLAKEFNTTGSRKVEVEVDPNTDDYAKITEDEGILGAYFKMRDGDDEAHMGLPYVMHMLDDLCRKVVMEFNEVQRAGWSLPGNGKDSTQDNAFFYDGFTNITRDANGNITGYTDSEGNAVTVNAGDNPFTDVGNFQHITALNFRLDDAVDMYSIAASDVKIIDGTGDAGPNNEQRNNNLNALKFVELLNKNDDAGNPNNFDSKYKEIIVAVGLEMSYINRMNKNQATVLANIQDQRTSVSGVSIDEEVTNIIKFGHSYNAASRVITALDEQLDVVINKMGIVGR